MPCALGCVTRKKIEVRIHITKTHDARICDLAIDDIFPINSFFSASEAVEEVLIPALDSKIQLYPNGIQEKPNMTNVSIK
jgi:hypothetical protein